MRHYERLSDEQLLATELEISNPESLEGLVDAVPEGDDEVFVEFSYAGDQEHRCVHQHHRHKKGYVMRKGDARFRVGWMCARELYGVEAFAKFEAEFKAAVQRRRGLLRRREIEQRLLAIMRFIENEVGGETVREFDRVSREIGRLPFVSGRYAPRFGLAATSDLFFDPLLADVSKKLRELQQSKASAEQALARLKPWLRDLVPEVEDVIFRLELLVDFFQPAMLMAICAEANKRDAPDRRTYEPGLMSLTCHRVGATKIVITLSPTYRPPDRTRFAELIAEFNALGTGNNLSAEAA